jgi:hypothetical protein
LAALVRVIKLVLMLSTLLLAACYPSKATFFEPSAEGGKVMKASCHGHVGYPADILFEREGVSVVIYTVRDKEIMKVYFRIPPGVSVSFRPNKFAWSSGSESHHLQPTNIETVTFVRPNDKETIPVSEWQILQGGPYDAYFVNFDVPIKELNNFSFVVPPLKINEKEITLPPVKFTLAKWMVCLSAKLLKRRWRPSTGLS